MDTRPRIVGPYRLLEPLGRGGMGVVYRAVHEDGRTVALKTVHLAAESQLSSLRREIHALARLRHPGIVRILDEGVSDGLPWYAMELLDGRPLQRYAQELGVGVANVPKPERREPAPGGSEETYSQWWTHTLDQSGVPSGALPNARNAPAAAVHAAVGLHEGSGADPGRESVSSSKLMTVLRVVRRLCAALAYLHGEGLVHRDLKPDNVLVKPDGMPVLVDFGLAAHFGGELSREVLVTAAFAAGTVHTMAPEQIRGELVDARADLYALGCILYELVTGRPPFEGQTAAELLWQHLNAEPESASKLMPDLPGPLDTLILRLLAKSPRQRLGQANDVAATLGRLENEDRTDADAAAQAAWPKPRAYLYRPGFAGREETLSELERHLQRLSEKSQGALVLVGGESGIGKTRLMLEVAMRATRRRIRVLSGESAPGEAGTEGAARSSGALQPLRKALQAVADRCREKGKDETERLLGRRVEVLWPYEPAFLGLPGQGPPGEPVELPAEAARLRLYSAVAETLSAFAEQQPLLLVLDDLQWADELTLGFLGFVARSIATADAQRGAPLLVFGTYRTEEVSEALRALLERSGAGQLRLGRLEEPAVGQMVCDMLALPESPSVFVRYLSRHSEGNPFFVAEYLRLAVREGLLWRDESGHWLVAEEGADNATEEVYERLPLPQSVRELVARHLGRLGAAALKLVESAAVLGKEVDGSLLHRVSGLAEVEFLEGTLELFSQQVMEEARRRSLRFVHDKLREVAYEHLPEPRRVELHRAAAEAIEASGAERRDEHLAELSHHWELAGVRGKARECFLAAARRAKAGYAHDESERLYRRYLRLVAEPTPESIAARNELGTDVLGIQGRTDEALAEHGKALEEARRIGHRGFEAESLRWLGQLVRTQGKVEPARELYEEALCIAREVGDRRLEGLVLAALARCREYQGRMKEGVELYEQALAIQREVGDRSLEGLVLGGLANSYKVLGRIEEAHEAYEQALAIHRAVGNRLLEGKVLQSLAISYDERGRLGEARELFEQALAIHREVGNRQSEGYALASMANACHNQGRLEEALELQNQALAIHREVGDRRFEGLALGNLANSYRDLGRVEEARELYDQALSIHREMGNRYYEGFLLGNLAEFVRVTTGELDRAEVLARKAEAMLSEVGDRMELVRLLCNRGHIELAKGRSAGELIARVEGLGREVTIGPDSELSQVLTRLRRAQEAFEAGQHGRLFRGELIEELPEGLRRWLVETDQFPGSLK